MAKAFTTDRTPDLGKAFPMKKDGLEGARTTDAIGGRVKVVTECSWGYSGVSNLSITKSE